MNQGGAFVVVPNAQAAPVTIKYPVIPFDLGEQLRQSWLSLSRVWRALHRKDAGIVAVRTSQEAATSAGED
jgi:hypothetical protein